MSSTLRATDPTDPTEPTDPAGPIDPAEPTDPASRPRGPSWVWAPIGWVLLIPPAIVLGLRWADLDRPLAIAATGLTPLAGLPVAGALLLAWLGRSRVLAAAAAVLAISLVAVVSPVDAVVGCRAEPAAGDSFTIYSANVLFDGGRPDDIAASITANDADVVVLQEANRELLQALDGDPRLAGFHRSNGNGGTASGTAIWSRWPLTDIREERFVVSKRVAATVETPAGPVEVVDVHTLAPARPEHVAVWRTQFDELSTIEPTGARILAGDFNATADHRPFRELVDRGWTDVHDAKGCGLDATWPVGPGLTFPVLRLDHILVTDRLEVLDVRLGDPGGSDHLPVIAELRLVDPEPDESQDRSVPG